VTLKVTIHNPVREPRPEMRLFLKQEGGIVKLCGRTENDLELVILHIDADGIRRVGGIGEILGWPVDKDGRLVIIN